MDKSYRKKHSDSNKTFSEKIHYQNAQDFDWQTIWCMFGGRVSQQSVSIPRVTNCASLLVDMLLYSYEADFIQVLLKKIENMLVRSFNFMLRYTYNVISLNNSKFCNYVDSIYPIVLEIKDSIDTTRFASYLDIHLGIENEGRLWAKLCDKRYDFSFFIVNFSFICSYVPPAPTCGVFISVDIIHNGLWFLSCMISLIDGCW
jgi:hypothetical protein